MKVPGHTRSFNGKVLRDGGTRARFAFAPQMEPHARKDVIVPRPETVVRHLSMFSDHVKQPDQVKRVLVSCDNNSKIGKRVEKGPWRGIEMFGLTLEERATCPKTCAVYWECYGNSLPLARRHAHGAVLERVLNAEIARLCEEHDRIAIRLHMLGDFYSTEYARLWGTWLHRYAGLHIWGYTAHPVESDVGQVLQRIRKRFPRRVGMRFSVPITAPEGPWQATTIWKGESSHGIICPAEKGQTAACVTCGICWNPAAAGKRIVFMGHGNLVRRGQRR